jgi:hypothetical protein
MGDGVNGTSPSFTDCLITHNSASGSGGGVYQTQAGSPQFLRCRVSGNSAGYGGAAAFHLAGTTPSFTSCTFYANYVTISGGTIRSGDSAVPEFDRCIIASGAYGSAVECVNAGSTPVFTCSDIYGNAGGDWTGCISGQAGTSGNFSSDPLFCNATAGDLSVRDNSLCAPARNPTCGGVGAMNVGCSDTPAERVTWGRIKASFR